MMPPAFLQKGRLARLALLGAGLLCLAAGDARALGPGAKFAGRVLFRGVKTTAPGVTVELVEAEDNGEPKDETLAATRADAEERFTVALPHPTRESLTLFVCALRTTAATGGDGGRMAAKLKPSASCRVFCRIPAQPNSTRGASNTARSRPPLITSIIERHWKPVTD